jgi:hypothetical protein
LADGIRLSKTAAFDRLFRLTPYLGADFVAHVMKNVYIQQLHETVQSHQSLIHPPITAAYRRSNAILHGQRSSCFVALRHNHLQRLLSVMDLLQLLTILSSRDPLFDSISAPRLFSICSPHRGCDDRISLAEALCIMTKLAAMAISLLSLGPIGLEWEGVSGGIGFLVLPFCFFGLMYDRFVAPPNAFQSVIKTTLLLLLGRAAANCAGPTAGNELRQMLQMGNSTRTLTNIYRFAGNEPFIDCLHRQKASFFCADITNKALDPRRANDELRNIIFHSIDSAPAALRDEVLKRARIDNDTHSVQFDSVGFKLLADAINNSFKLGTDHASTAYQELLSPRAAACDSVLCMDKFAAAVAASPLLTLKKNENVRSGGGGVDK